jgi:hypothetical protein
MKFILKNNQWEVSYLDSNRVPHTFYHPTEVLDTTLYNETNEKHMTIITEEKLKEIFPSDSSTEQYVNYMKEKGIIFGDSHLPLPN